MTNNRIVFKICLCCYVFLIKFYSYVHRKNDIYHDVKDPKHRNEEASVTWRLDFKFFPEGSLMADHDGLEDTQEASGGNGHAPENSKNIQK